MGLSRRARASAGRRPTLPDFRDAAGRVHLAVHRGAASGRAVFGLRSPLFEERWQDEVATSAVNTAVGVLGQDVTIERVLELTRGAMNSTSRLVLGLLSHAPHGAIACRAGCDHCCHVTVGVTLPEALTIFDHLAQSLSVEALNELKSRIAAFRERTRGLSSAERFSPEYPCVFLAAGRCSIYEVRPFACRGMNSLDATECETRLRDPAARQQFAAQGGGRLFLEPVRAFRAVSAGLQIGLAELYNLDMRPLELSAAMHLLFESGATRIRAWLSGQNAFGDAAIDSFRTPAEAR
jgi:Fe-S-cluster containining protein